MVASPGIDTDGAVYTLTTGGTTTKTFTLPDNVEEGRKLLVICFQTGNNRITVEHPNINGGGATAWTQIMEATETFLEPYAYVHTVEAADVGETTAQFICNGVAEWVLMCAWIGDVDFDTIGADGVQSNGNSTHFGQFVPVDTLDTDPKLFLVMALHQRDDSTETEAATYDFAAWNDAQGDGDTGVAIPSGSYGWGYHVSSDQVFGAQASDGEPHFAKRTGSSGDSIGLWNWFNIVDDANWPYTAPEPDPPPAAAPASGGASDADLGVRRTRRSASARRLIVDDDDPRRKYRLPY